MSWPVKKFKEVATIVTGSTPKKKDEYFNGDIPFVTPGDLGANAEIRTSERSLTQKGADTVRLLPVGSVLVCCIGATIGKVGIAGTNLTTNQQINSLHFDETKVFPRYGYYYCLTLKNLLISKSSSTTMPIVNKSSFSEIEMPLPPLAEQKRIASILDKADAIRRKRQQAIDLADDFLRAVFLDMFGSMVNKEDWKSVNFGDVTLIDAAMVDPREDEYLDMLHIGPDRIEKNTGKLLPALSAREEGLISKKFLFNDSYVLYSKIRPYLRKVALPEFEGLCSADMYPIRPVEGMMTREYLWQLLLSDEFTQYTETLPGRANIPKLNRNELAAFSFKLPPIELQKRFTTIFCQYNKNLTASQFGNEKTRELFNSLSQKAFSGDL